LLLEENQRLRTQIQSKLGDEYEITPPLTEQEDDFDIEEAYIKKLQKEGAFNMNSKSAKKISNKAILEPKEYKQADTIKCKSCGAVMEYKGYKRGCQVCNTING
jgi:hypothetical protein